MVNKSQRKTYNKAATTVTSGARVPKVRTRIQKMDAGGAIVHSRWFQPISTTGIAAQGTALIVVAPASNPTGTDAGGAVIRNYQEYTMRNARCIYTPLLGSNNVGTIWLAYLDNPEIFNKILTGVYSVANITSIVKSTPNAVSGPIWMPLELNASMNRRRTKYTVNTQITGLTDADIDNQVHGYFVAVTEGLGFSVQYGQYTLEYTAVGHNLQLAAVTGI